MTRTDKTQETWSIEAHHEILADVMFDMLHDSGGGLMSLVMAIGERVELEHLIEKRHDKTVWTRETSATAEMSERVTLLTFGTGSIDTPYLLMPSWKERHITPLLEADGKHFSISYGQILEKIANLRKCLGKPDAYMLLQTPDGHMVLAYESREEPPAIYWLNGTIEEMLEA